jgi:MFS family permease
MKEKKKETEENKKIEKAKKYATKQAAAYSLMDGFGLRFITPYALAVGANNKHIGLLNSIPSLFGTLSQLFTLKIMNRWSRKKITFWAVFFQALMWLVLLLAGLFYFVFKIQNEIPAYLVIIIYTLLIFVGSFCGPAWGSWMKDLVRKDMGSFFGRQSRIAGTIALICMLLAGFILDYFKKTHVFIGFIIIFFLAFVGRFFSSQFVKKMYEPEYKEEPSAYFSLFDFIKRMRSNNYGRFVIYFALVSLTTAISSPFFAVYMLKNLNFSYSFYMFTVLSSSITSILAVPFWGKFADKYGNLKVMQITGAFVPFIPFLWLSSVLLIGLGSTPILIYIIIIEGLSGVAWAGFNLCASNFIYDAVTRQRMAICVCYFNILNGFGILVGALIGGFVSSMNFVLLGLTPLYFVFVMSGIARFLVYFGMKDKIKEVREVKSISIRKEIRKGIKIFFNSISMKKFFESQDSEFKLSKE